jgi:hypothetical protein
MPAQAAPSRLLCLRVPGRCQLHHGASSHDGRAPGSWWFLILPRASHVIACLPARRCSTRQRARGRRSIIGVRARMMTCVMARSGPGLGGARSASGGWGLLGDLFAQAVPGHTWPPRWGEGTSCGVGDPRPLGRESATWPGARTAPQLGRRSQPGQAVCCQGCPSSAQRSSGVICFLTRPSSFPNQEMGPCGSLALRP